MRTEHPRRVTAALMCGCHVHYPPGVTARRHEHVLCLRHGATITATISRAPCAATIERRDRRTRAATSGDA